MEASSLLLALRSCHVGVVPYSDEVKKEKERQRISEQGHVPQGEICEGGKVSTHSESTSQAGLRGELWNIRRKLNGMCSEGKTEKSHHAIIDK